MWVVWANDIDALVTTGSVSFGVPLLESEAEFPSYPHYPQNKTFTNTNAAVRSLTSTLRGGYGLLEPSRLAP